MSFWHYLILGILAYASGFGLRRYLTTRLFPETKVHTEKILDTEKIMTEIRPFEDKKRDKIGNRTNKITSAKVMPAIATVNSTTISPKTVYHYTAIFFVIMLGVAWCLNNWVLKNVAPDFAFIGVCSLVATFIFYQGLAVDKNHELPD